MTESKADLRLSRPSSQKVESHYVPVLNIPAQDGGAYLLVLELGRGTHINVGALGSIWFPEGAYAYVGSARNGLECRIKHHLKNNKRLHWHIDYLRQFAVPRFVIYAVTTDGIECRLASSLMKRFSAFRSFGCTDCGCISHLFYHETADLILKVGIAVRGKPCSMS